MQMKKFLYTLLLVSIILSACSTVDNIIAEATGAEPNTYILYNEGNNTMEGNTPRGYAGSGPGLFVGDDLHSDFPSGDGVQAFISFNLSSLGSQNVTEAVLRTTNYEIRGTPFKDLGNLIVDEMRYANFNDRLWAWAPVLNGADCVFATSAQGPFSCDVTEGLQIAFRTGRTKVQFRLRTEIPGDGDGVQDMIFFYISDLNATEPGIFELQVTVLEKEEDDE